MAFSCILLIMFWGTPEQTGPASFIEAKAAAKEAGESADTTGKTGEKDRATADIDKLSSSRKRILLLFMDRLSPRELYQGAGLRLREIIKNGSRGLMNSQTAGRGSSCGYLTLGAGARSLAGEKGNKAFHYLEKYRDSPAGELYRLNQGESPPGEVIHPFYFYLQEKNRGLNYTVQPGALGEALRNENKKTAVLGNADTCSFNRAAVLPVMDGRGSVDNGSPGSALLKQDLYFPYGKRTDGMKMAGAVNEAKKEASLVAVEWGDTTRLDEYRSFMTPEGVEEASGKIFAEIEIFLENLKLQPAEQTLFILAVPSPPERFRGTGKTLTPLVLAGGEYANGILSSATTRREGLATNLDVAPTALEFLEVDRPGGMSGSEMLNIPQEKEGGEKIKAPVYSMFRRAAAVHELRPAFLRPFVLGQIIILLGGISVVVLPFFKRLRRVWVVLLEASLLFPLSFLLLAVFPSPVYLSLFWSWLVLLFLVAAFLLMLNCLKRHAAGRVLFWSALGLLVTAFIGGDLVTGAGLQKYSLMGYDLVAGSRYYGLGNEYMGVLLGASVLGGSSLWGFALLKLKGEGGGFSGGVRPGKRWLLAVIFFLLAIYFLAVVLLAAAPFFGANVGGAVAICVAAGVMALHMVNGTGFLKSGKARKWAPYLAVVSFLVALLVFWYYILNYGPGEEWHLQAFWERLVRGETEEVQQSVFRKLSMNLRLIRYSIWSRVLLVLLGTAVILFFYPVGVIKRFKKEGGFLFYGATAVIAGGITALLINDSGVVAAATALMYGIAPMLIFFLEDEMQGLNKKAQ